MTSDRPTINNLSPTPRPQLPPLSPSTPPLTTTRGSAGVFIGGDNDVREREEEFDKQFPKGVRFCPTDEELIEHYLLKKVMDRQLPKNRIPDVNLYKFNPWDITRMHKNHVEDVWYFFSPRNRKYPNGSRPDRSAGAGYWKPTGKDHQISCKSENGRNFYGYKNSLDFYIGKHSQGIKTDWKMTEYRITQTGAHPTASTSRGRKNNELDRWVLCKVYKNSRAKKDADPATTETLVDKPVGDSSRDPLATVPFSDDSTSFDLQNNTNFEGATRRNNPFGTDFEGATMSNNPFDEIQNLGDILDQPLNQYWPEPLVNTNFQFDDQFMTYYGSPFEYESSSSSSTNTNIMANFGYPSFSNDMEMVNFEDPSSSINANAMMTWEYPSFSTNMDIANSGGPSSSADMEMAMAMAKEMPNLDHKQEHAEVDEQETDVAKK